MNTNPFKIKKFSECTSEEQSLLSEAARARLNAQAPYSNYYVGAAILSDKGAVYRGCNVERCTFTQTTHAEQNAIDNMVVNEGPVKITMVAIVGAAMDKLNQSISDKFAATAITCGHCLQIIWENCQNDPDIKILTLLEQGNVGITTIGEALPIRFCPLILKMDSIKITNQQSDVL